MIKQVALLSWRVIGSCALLIHLCAPLRAAESTLNSSKPSAQVEEKKVKKNYLPSLIGISKGAEKKFYEALQKSGDEALMDDLGLLQVQKLKQSGSMTNRDGKTSPLYYDEGETIAMNFGKRLRWDAGFGEGDQARRVLLFDEQIKSWPGWQPITLVLVDKQFKVVSWLTSGGSPMFSSASLQTTYTATTLETRSRRRQGGVEIDNFNISETKIEKVNSRIERFPASDYLPRKK